MSGRNPVWFLNFLNTNNSVRKLNICLVRVSVGIAQSFCRKSSFLLSISVSIVCHPIMLSAMSVRVHNGICCMRFAASRISRSDLSASCVEILHHNSTPYRRIGITIVFTSLAITIGWMSHASSSMLVTAKSDARALRSLFSIVSRDVSLLFRTISTWVVDVAETMLVVPNLTETFLTHLLLKTMSLHFWSLNSQPPMTCIFVHSVYSCRSCAAFE